VAPFPRPRVLYVLWPEPLIVPGRASILTELIDIAGGTSITAGDGEAYPRFSLEAVVARAPEVIILADHSTGTSTAGRPAPEQWQRLASVPAIKAGRLHSADLSILHRYGPRVPEGLETLARIIHPEAFR
jgi:iron complex transport system substrate-binding protein